MAKKPAQQNPKPLNEGQTKSTFGKDKPTIKITQTAPPPAPKPKK